MAGRYFNVTVTPTIPASALQAAAFTAADVLFDWTSFEIPKGGARLIGATMMVRPKGNASPSPNEKGSYLVFATNDTQPAGTPNGAPIHRPSNDLIGLVEFDDATSFALTLKSTSIASSGRAASDNAPHPSIVFAREDGSEGQGSSVGYDKFYVRGVANGAFDFISINTIQTTEAASATIHCDGSGMDLREHFLPGDILHTATTVGAAGADLLIGTVLSVDSATNITLTETAAVTHVDGTIIMNINPIRIVLHFEN